MTNRNLLYLPGIMILLAGFLNVLFKSMKAERIARQRAKAKAEAARARAERLAAANAERAARRAAEAAKPKRRPGRPRKNPLPEQAHDSAPAPAPVPVPAPVQVPAPVPAPAVGYVFRGNNMFRGQVVSFTGKIPGMTRTEAIEAVRANGGTGYTNMPVSTTLLVVGEDPGEAKLEKADSMISTCRKITADHFTHMLNAPLTLTPEEFAAYVTGKGVSA